MFKDDKKSLEQLATNLTPEELAKTKAFLQKIEKKELTTYSGKELQNIYSIIEEISTLQLKSSHYAFHVYDSYAEMNGNSEGVELYKRVGDHLEEEFRRYDRDSLYEIDELIDYCKEQNITHVISGNFAKEIFLDFHRDFLDDEDPGHYSGLDKQEVEALQEAGIKVTYLEILI